MNLKYQAELQTQLLDGLQKLVKNEPKLRFCNIEVIFQLDENKFVFSLDQAIDVLRNDLFFDERGDWSDCKICKVREF